MKNNKQKLLTKENFDQMRSESIARRKAHPKWPSHRPTFTDWNGVTTVSETMPIGKAKGVEGYCKYCYRTHRSWWAMDPRESFEGSTLLLCGHCEHTSLERYI